MTGLGSTLTGPGSADAVTVHFDSLDDVTDSIRGSAPLMDGSTQPLQNFSRSRAHHHPQA